MMERILSHRIYEAQKALGRAVIEGNEILEAKILDEIARLRNALAFIKGQVEAQKEAA